MKTKKEIHDQRIYMVNNNCAVYNVLFLLFSIDWGMWCKLVEFNFEQGHKIVMHFEKLP